MDWTNLLMADLGVPVGMPHACPYLPERDSAERAFIAHQRLPADLYQGLMDHGWRRSGRVVYKPACPGCNACVPIRVDVQAFRPNRTQRRLLKRNADIDVRAVGCEPTEEKFDLFVRYQRARHTGEMCTTWDEFSRFLYASPVGTREFEFRIGARLVGVAIADLGPRYVSAVYTWFETDMPERSLGTWAILWFLEYAKSENIPHYYLGYFISECRKMNYKTRFQPCELGDGRGGWTRMDEKHAG